MLCSLFEYSINAFPGISNWLHKGITCTYSLLLEPTSKRRNNLNQELNARVPGKVGKTMPGESIAEYGIAFFAVAGLIYLFAQMITVWLKKGDQNEVINTVNAVTEVIQNNTEALNRLETMIEVTLTRQETKLDEVVAYARREKG